MIRPAFPVAIRRLRPTVVALLVIFLVSASFAFGAVLVVHPDGSGPYPSIQAAIDAAASGDVIELTDGVFQGSGNGSLDTRGKVLTFRSQSGSAESCVISLGGAQFIGNMGSSPGVRVESLQLLHARGTYIYQSTMEFASCILESCFSVVSGGYASVGYTDCLFRNPAGSQSGVGENGSLYLDGCVVQGASAPVFQTNHLQATDCRFEANEAECLIEGEFSFFPASIDLERCQFLGNECSDALIRGGEAYLEADERTFAENEGTTIRWDASYGMSPEVEIRLTSCTLAENRGAGTPEISVRSEGGSAVALTLEQTILAFRDGGPAVICTGITGIAATCSDVYGNSGGDWTGCLAGLDGTGGNLSADPLFCRQQPNPYLLREDSPCLPHGACGLIGAWGSGCPVAGAGEGGLADASRLFCRPNPFRADVLLDLGRPPRDGVRLELFDASGRLVRAISWPAGRSGVTWDGSDEQGRPLPAGLYLARIEGRSASLVLLR